eukprot:scaffold104370_cov22-Tisochrysis_lutea.AAC.1
MDAAFHAVVKAVFYASGSVDVNAVHHALAVAQDVGPYSLLQVSCLRHLTSAGLVALWACRLLATSHLFRAARVVGQGRSCCSDQRVPGGGRQGRKAWGRLP